MMELLLSQPESQRRERTVLDENALDIVLTMRVHGDELDPAAVSALLGAPTVAARKGEKFKPSDKVVAPTGTWFLEAKPITLAPGSWFKLPARPFSERAGDALATLQAKIDLSILFLGTPDEVKAAILKNASEIAAFVTSEARYADVDIDVPNLGIDWVLERGREVNADELVAELHLAEPGHNFESD